MSRRGNGEGTITRRKDGRWEARYYALTASGTSKTRAEVAGKLTNVLSDRIDGIVYDDENATLGEFPDGWLKGSVQGSVRRSTYDRDKNLADNHIRPILGGLRLTKLHSAHVQAFYRDRLDAGLSPSTVHKLHDILRRGLAQAVKWHLVPRNVADAVKPPRPAPRNVRDLSAEETRRLLAAAEGSLLEALCVLAVHTSMRRGGPLALMWQDVDLENAVVSVRRSLTRSGGKTVFGEPKTKGSRRSIRRTPQAVDALKGHLERQLRDIAILGDRYRDQGLVFATDAGAPINPSNLRQRSLAPLLKRAGPAQALPRPPPHVRNVAAVAGRPPETRPGVTRSRHRSHDTRHLLPRDAEHGRRDGEGHRSRAHIAQSTTCRQMVVKRAGICSRPSFRSFGSACMLQTFLKWACLDSKGGPLPYQRSATAPSRF